MGGLRWVVQEPNDETLWNKVKFGSVTPFLMGLWRRGAFGSGAPDEVFTVKIDAENNPPASVQQGILNIEVYFYPVRPAETIIITVGQQESGATASES
jgi:phage tail sheath protein FI